MAIQLKDDEYRKKVQLAITEAIFEVSRNPTAEAIVINNGDTIIACLNVIAFLAATSDETSTPTKLRELCQDIAKDLRQRILEMRRIGDAGGLDFLTIIKDDETKN